MLDKPIGFSAGAVLLGLGIIAHHSVAAKPSVRDRTICSVVVPATVTLLLPFDGGFFRAHQERIIAACAESVAGHHCESTPTHQAYPFFDVSRLNDGEAAAILREPSSIAAWLRRKDTRRLGDLPLRLLKGQTWFKDALIGGDPKQSVERAAVVIALATQASLPWGSVAPRSALLADTLRVNIDRNGDRCFCCLTLRDRIESGLVRRNIARVRFEVRPYRGRLQVPVDADGDILREILRAHAALHDLITIERDVLSELQIKTPRQLIQEQDRYFDRLGSRCLATLEARLEAGAVLAARLLLRAWTSAGMDERGFGRDSALSRSNEDARGGRSGEEAGGDEAESTGRFVGSAHSSVVHQSTCAHVKRIHQKNLVHFKSLERAIKAGRKPCRLCKPK